MDGCVMGRRNAGDERHDHAWVASAEAEEEQQVEPGEAARPGQFVQGAGAGNAGDTERHARLRAGRAPGPDQSVQGECVRHRREWRGIASTERRGADAPYRRA